MGEIKTVIAAGGIVIKDYKYLLVRTTYGNNKGLWMLPGGMVEPGEAIEEAAVREVFEESGIRAMIYISRHNEISDGGEGRQNEFLTHR